MDRFAEIGRILCLFAIDRFEQPRRAPSPQLAGAVIKGLGDQPRRGQERNVQRQLAVAPIGMVGVDPAKARFGIGPAAFVGHGFGVAEIGLRGDEGQADPVADRLHTRDQSRQFCPAFYLMIRHATSLSPILPQVPACCRPCNSVPGQRPAAATLAQRRVPRQAV